MNNYVLIPIVILSCCTVLGSFYGVAFRFASKPLTGSRATWSSSLWAGVCGVAVALLVMFGMMIPVMAFRGAIEQSPYLSMFLRYAVVLVFGSAIVAQIFVAGRMLRTAEDKRFGFVNGLKTLIIPTALVILYFGMTYRPPPDQALF